MATYQEEREQEKKYLSGMARKVISLLGGEWAVDRKWLKDTNNGLMLNGPDGRALHFCVGWAAKGRLGISGSFRNGLNQHLPYDREKTEITVSKDKTPAQIAKDIERRLMPVYERVLARAGEMKARCDEYEKEKSRALERVREAMGGDADVRQGEVFGYKPYSFQAKYYGEGQIKFEITLPLAKAVTVLKRLSLAPFDV